MIATRKSLAQTSRKAYDEGHIVLSGIDWENLEAIVDALGKRRYHIAYDDGELELMTVSFEHDNFSRWIGRLIFLMAMEWNRPIRTGGGTTLKHSLRQKGIEPDECFWIANEAAMRGKKRWEAATMPPPDLAVEVDITRSWLDRLGIYAALGVPEVWCFDGAVFQVWLLGTTGDYKEKSKSKAFPLLHTKEFASFITRLGDEEETQLTAEFRAWLRGETTGPKPKRKPANGK